MAKRRKNSSKKSKSINYNLIFAVLIIGTIVALWILTSPAPTANVTY